MRSHNMSARPVRQFAGSNLSCFRVRQRSALTVKSVLFVCTGNICRSPIAEGLFRRLLGNRNDIEAASAGVHAVRGQPPILYAVQVCETDGVNIGNLLTQPVPSDLLVPATPVFHLPRAH